MTVLMKIPPEFSVLPEFTVDASNPHPMDRPRCRALCSPVMAGETWPRGDWFALQRNLNNPELRLVAGADRRTVGHAAAYAMMSRCS